MRERGPRALRRLAMGLVLAGGMVVAGAGLAAAAGVTMVDDSFQPSRVTVAAGSSVTFFNHGDSPHTATADDGSFNSGIVDPGASKTVVLRTPGTYTFYCQFHGGPGGSTAGSGAAAASGGSTSTAPLPQTASPLPLLLGLGAVLLVAGLWVGRRAGA